jgi:V/A-type H+-transporting ATPase subunit D
MIGPEQAPTRAALLALKDERTVVTEAYNFLDEKRLLLAAELLRQLDQYQQILARTETLAGKAKQNLAAATARHGLQGLGVYPAASLEGFRLTTRERNFMGVTLIESDLHIPPADDSLPAMASNPSSEAEACRMTFQEILQQGAALSELSGNIHRLLLEYRLTERRARALENIILPEIDQALGDMTVHLEEMELEDVIRAHVRGNLDASASHPSPDSERM